jgi:hypothetical protein
LRCRTGWIGVALLALESVSAAAPAGARPGIVLVEDWSEQPLGRVGVPIGWEARSWGPAARYDFRVERRQDDGEARKVLHLVSDGDNSTISKRVARIDVRAYPILEWHWRIMTLPRGGDSRTAATDDQAGQIYVVFPRFPTAARSRVIGYVWDSTAPAGGVFRSATSSMVTYVVVRSGSDGLGQWLTERRNVLEDFTRIHGEAPAEAVEVVSIGIDSNDTRSRAESYMGDIRFRAVSAAE